MVYSVINILHNSLLFSRSFLVFFHFAHSLLHFPASLCVYSTFLSVTSHSYYFLMWLAVFWVPVLLSNWIYLCLIIFGKCVPFLSLNDLLLLCLPQLHFLASFWFSVWTLDYSAIFLQYFFFKSKSQIKDDFPFYNIQPFCAFVLVC